MQSLVGLCALGDEELVDAVSNADSRAFEELYGRHSARVFGCARHVLTNEDLAADVTQDVFTRLWINPQRYDARRGTLRGFLLTDTRGRCIDRIRADTRRRGREKTYTEMPASIRDTESDAAAARVDIHEVLACLPKVERDAIYHAFFVGLTYHEVARLFGCPEGTIKSRIRAGLRRLQQDLVTIS